MLRGGQPGLGNGAWGDPRTGFSLSEPHETLDSWLPTSQRGFGKRSIIFLPSLAPRSIMALTTACSGQITPRNNRNNRNTIGPTRPGTFASQEKGISMEQDQLDSVLAWEELEPEPDQTLLEDLQTQIERFVDLPTPAHGLLLATYVVHTWCIEAAFVTPYLYISSAGPSCGKTRTMDVLASFVRNADSGTDSPGHVLGQEIAADCPTLFFDEVDTVWAGTANNALKRILNIGYMRGAVIKRQRANQVEKWSVFCAKVLAGIRNNHLPQSLLSRCIPIEMQPRKRELERFNKFHVQRDSHRNEVIERIAYFSEAFMLDVANQRPEPLKVLDDRQNEICEPLLAIASVLGRESDLREALRTVFGKQVGKATREQVLLSRVKRAFERQALVGKPTDRIFTEDLLQGLGPAYTPRLLGILLEEMGFVRTASETIRIGTYTKRGYAYADFQPLFERYLDVERPSSDVETLEEEAIA